jgi:ComF family protein
MNLLSAILSAVFPPHCICCDKIIEPENEPKASVCADCNSAVNWLDTEFFSAHLKEIYFDTARSLAAHDGVWAQVVHNFKYNRRTDLAAPLGELLSKKVFREYDLIVPVPLHKNRLRERGYNQSALLAKRTAKETGMSAESFLLVRTVLQPPQVGLEQAKRIENVKGVFAVRKISGPKDKDILLIDDVMTTGATANECARALKKAGARRVDVLTVARTM